MKIDLNQKALGPFGWQYGSISSNDLRKFTEAVEKQTKGYLDDGYSDVQVDHTAASIGGTIHYTAFFFAYKKMG